MSTAADERSGRKHDTGSIRRAIENAIYYPDKAWNLLGNVLNWEFPGLVRFPMALWKVGDRVLHGVNEGTVRFVGPVDDSDDVWCGVELVKPGECFTSSPRTRTYLVVLQLAEEMVISTGSDTSRAKTALHFSAVSLRCMSILWSTKPPPEFKRTFAEALSARKATG